MPVLVVDFLLLPAVGAFHGWLTNYLAIRLLFRPRRPLNILGLTFQGALPKRREALARKIGVVVEEELVSVEALFTKLRREGLDARLETAVGAAVDDRLEALLPRLIPSGLRQTLKAQLLRAIMSQASPALGTLLDEASSEITERLHLAESVEERLLALDLDALESLVRRTAGREIRSIERLGFTMGLLIGLIQGTVLYVIGFGR